MTVDMRKRVKMCDGPFSGWARHDCAQSHEYYLAGQQWEPDTTTVLRDGSTMFTPAGVYETDEQTWMCDDCAAILRATHVIVRQTVKEIWWFKDGERMTRRETHDVWKKRA